jgi:CRP/FNR family cyclic AMP-dependent transcriptional regulator
MVGAKAVRAKGGLMGLTARNGLSALTKCTICSDRLPSFFCNLSAQAVSELQRVRHTVHYPVGNVVFSEGEPPRGVYLLCKGKIKLSIGGSDGKTLILHIAEPGELLGLSSAISRRPYQTTAEAREDCQMVFISQEDLTRLMRQHNDICLRVAEHLSQRYSGACREIRSLALSHSAAGKLAKLLLEWAPENHDASRPSQLKLTMTHEEMAEMIGTSRETVTRLFAEFKKKQLIQANGTTLLVRNRTGLQSLIGT